MFDGGQIPFASFARLQKNLAGDVWFAARSDEAKSLFVARTHGRMHGKFQFDGFVELGVELDVANVAMRGAGELRERGVSRHGRGAAVRAKHLPAQIQKPGTRGVQKQFQNVPAVGIPFSRDGEWTDAR